MQNNNLMYFTAGAALAAGASASVYYLNNSTGKRHRADTRDRVRRMGRKTKEEADRAVRDVAHRATGIVAEVKGRIREREVSDEILEERVRATLGHFCSHPSSVNVTAENGVVTLSGSILADEVRGLVRAVKSIRGVQDVEERFTTADESGQNPELQGEGKLPSHPVFRRRYWPPAYRFGLGFLGSVLGGAGLVQRGPVGGVMAAAGAGLLIRSITNQSLRGVFGAGGPPGIQVRKAIHVNVPANEVFELWRQPEKFPEFMHFVRNVERLPDGGFLWTVRGPGEINVSWIADEVHVEDNRMISWCSRPGSIVKSEGQVSFEAIDDDTTVIHVQMEYAPPAGAIGHMFASLFQADPKTVIDGDLLRMKTLLETGRAPHDAARKNRATASA